MDISLDRIFDKTISIYLSSAHSAQSQGNRKMAKRLYRNALTLTRKTADSDGYLISILVGLSFVYLGERRPRKAELLALRAQQIMKNARRENDDLFCQINLLLAECYVMQQRFALSNEHVKHVLDYFNNRKVCDTTNLASRLGIVGQAYFRASRFQEASEIVKELIRLQN
jgi:tetratricopeptide (TPR) repeat protein